MVFKQIHHFQSIHFILLVKGNKGELLRVLCNIFERPLNSVEIVSTN